MQRSEVSPAQPMLIKRALRRVPVLRRTWARWRYWNAMRKLRGPRLVRRFAQLYPQARFVQIGANDGDQLDPLRKALFSASWSGVMVEPVPYVFERLKENTRAIANRVALENVAISSSPGVQPFWHLRQAVPGEQLPRLYDALGSFRKDVVLKHVDLIPDIHDRLVCSEVACQTFDEVCARHGLDGLDLIQMDTEGYDFDIIKTIDFKRYRPALVMYEHHHLSPDEQRQCLRLMSEQGFESFSEGLDTWCLQMQPRTRAHQQLIDCWRRLA